MVTKKWFGITSLLIAVIAVGLSQVALANDDDVYVPDNVDVGGYFVDNGQVYEYTSPDSVTPIDFSTSNLADMQGFKTSIFENQDKMSGDVFSQVVGRVSEIESYRAKDTANEFYNSGNTERMNYYNNMSDSLALSAKGWGGEIDSGSVQAMGNQAGDFQYLFGPNESKTYIADNIALMNDGIKTDLENKTYFQEQKAEAKTTYSAQAYASAENSVNRTIELEKRTIEILNMPDSNFIEPETSRGSGNRGGNKTSEYTQQDGFKFLPGGDIEKGLKEDKEKSLPQQQPEQQPVTVNSRLTAEGNLSYAKEALNNSLNNLDQVQKKYDEFKGRSDIIATYDIGGQGEKLWNDVLSNVSQINRWTGIAETRQQELNKLPTK